MQPVTVAVAGGLGNQLFQLAAATYAASATGRDIELCFRMADRGALRRAFVHVRRAVRRALSDRDGAFRVDAMERRPEIVSLQCFARQTDPTTDRRRGLTRQQLKAVFRDRGSIESVLALRTPADVRDFAREGRSLPGHVLPLVAGNMQTDEFARTVLQSLRSNLRLPFDAPRCERWVAELRHPNVVGVHVRRGDYMKSAYRNVFALLSPEWYVQAAEAIRDRVGADVCFAVFTDDPAWARSSLALPGRTVMVSGDAPPSAVEDLALLSVCHHHIIANSTYSWWGARLSDRGGFTAYPTDWFMQDRTPTELFPPDWIGIHNPMSRNGA
jgi:hypothetical protein